MTQFIKKQFAILVMMIAILGNAIHSYAQEYKVESFEIAPKDLSARTEGRVDGNGRKCAIIKVYVKDAITDTDGPVVGEIRDRGMEKWIYVSHDAKQVGLLFKEHLPLRVTFDDYDFTTLSGNMTYIMKLNETEKVNDSLVSTKPIQELSTPLSTEASPTVHPNNPVSNQVSSSNVRQENGDSINELDLVIQNLINNMVNIEGGTFNMGSNDSKDEKPVHQEIVNSFSIGKYEVTQKEWMTVMGNNPSSVKGDNLPVFNVSWNDCQEFILKLNTLTGKNFRLPTEEEWEYASKGGNKSNGYKYSGSDEINRVAWYNGNSRHQDPGRKVVNLLESSYRSRERNTLDELASYIKHQERIKESTHKVGTKDPNELGLYDMSGSVWEWTSSNWNDNYKKPRNSTKLVIRGGGWLDIPLSCRVTNRVGLEPQNDPSGSVFLVGLRLAM